MVSHHHPYIHVLEHPAFMAQPCESFDERVSRSQVVPHLFRFAELEALRLAFAERPNFGGFWGTSTVSHGKADPWVELKVGQTITEESASFTTKTGKRYTVIIKRTAAAEHDSWSLVYNYNTLAKGTDMNALWAELDRRKATQKRV